MANNPFYSLFCVPIFLLALFFSTNVQLSSADTSSIICKSTPYPSYCNTVLPAGNSSSSVYDYGRFSVRKSLTAANKFLSLINKYLRNSKTLTIAAVRALEDCKYLAESNIDYITSTLQTVSTTSQTLGLIEADEVQTILSAILTNVDTCIDGLHATASTWSVRNGILSPLSNDTRLYSVSLALFTKGWVPSKKKKRSSFVHGPAAQHKLRKGHLDLRFSAQNEVIYNQHVNGRRLLQAADVVDANNNTNSTQTNTDTNNTNTNSTQTSTDTNGTNSNSTQTSTDTSSTNTNSTQTNTDTNTNTNTNGTQTSTDTNSTNTNSTQTNTDTNTNSSSQVLVSGIVVVSQDGSGNFTTINDAINAAPINSNGTSAYFVVYITAGVYEEYVSIAKNKKYLMMIGAGINQTIITGNHNVVDGWTTFNSPTFAVVATGFVAVNITFRNTAGPAKHQAVAVRNGADLSTFYSCSFEAYQDTLYVHSLRQFYRECDVYGTVDFIFGNGAVVLQDCNLYPRLPMSGQFNAITAQGRTDPNQNTGISIHNCTIRAADDLANSNATVKTYLGRPWKEYSRAVYMQSFMDSLIYPTGWNIWSGDFALNTSYYAEFDNYGPGSDTSNRVTWPGFHVINATDAANFTFTVSAFLVGDAWIPQTGVPYTGGLL